MLHKSRSQRIRELAIQGLKPFEIRKITGDSFNLIYHNRRRLGLTKSEPPRQRVELTPRVRTRRGWTAAQIAEMRALKNAGASYREIGDAFGVTRNRVQQLLRGKIEGRCQKCGTTKNLHAHHKNYITNECATLCTSCHRTEHCE